MSDEPKFEHDGPDWEELEGGFANPFEHPEARVGGPIEDLEETEKARQAEQDERDAQASEREELGFSLMWWRDKSLLEAHRAMGDLFDNLLAALAITKGLRAGGLPADVQTVQMPLDRVGGPLVMAGLQLLGMYFPELRDDIKATLRAIPKPMPTDEEKEQIQAAIEELDRMEAEAMREELERFARLQQENGDAGMN